MSALVSARQRHIETAEAGRAAAHQLSDITDEVVRELARAASPSHRGRWALVALGGWGSGALLPKSDLDILILSNAAERELKPFVEAVLYPLWDAGLKVGHQVRSPKQQLKAMRDDVKTATAGLTARPFAGDIEWAQTAVSQWLADANRRGDRLLESIAARTRPGSPCRLEPDLKEDRGGRRDYDEITWSASVLAGRRCESHDSLVGAGLLSPDESSRLHEAADVVTAARWLLHREGFGNHMSIEAGSMLGSLAEAAQAALGTTAVTLANVRRRRAGDAPLEPALTREALFEALDGGVGSYERLELAAIAGALEELTPGIRRLMSCRRPGLGHELTVGAHQLRAATLVASPESSGSLARSLETLTTAQRRVVQTAALVHDNGKLLGGAGHAERGAEPARAVALRLGHTEHDADEVADLVRHHLLLIETALRDDLDDEDAILRCAAALGRRELLAPLHLLSAADSRATGPSTWTPWTETLVSTLVARLDSALSEEVDGAGLVSRGEAVRSATLSAMAASAGRERSFVEAAPLRYLASREPSEVARDARLVADLTRDPSAPALVAVTPGPATETHAVTIVAPTGPAVLARLAGAVSLAGLQILAVDAFEGPDGTVLDRFVVTSATRRAVSTDTFTRLERLVDTALRDRLELRTRLAERRSHYPTRRNRRTEVKVEPTGWATVLRVKAPDRPGLLHDIAQAVADSSLGIAWAKATTVDGIASDVFHLVADDGSPATDPGELGHVVMRVREML